MTSSPALRFQSNLLFDSIRRQLAERVLVSYRVDEPYLGWDWSFLVEGLLNGYKRTAEVRYLELIEQAIEHAFRWRDSDRNIVDASRSRSLHSWGLNQGESWSNNVTIAGRIVAPSLEYLRVCQMAGRPPLAGLLEKCATSVEEFVPEFEVSGDEGLFRRPARGDWEPLNHALSMGRALLRLGQVMGNGRYITMATQLAVFFKNSLFLEDGSKYAWAYRPNFRSRALGFPNNYWKADIDLSFALDCFESRIVFDENDIRRFVRTLTSSIVRPDFLNARISTYKAIPVREKANKIGPRIYGICGWMILAPFDPGIETLLEREMARLEDIMPGGWLAVPRAIFGYSLKSA